MNTKNRIVHLSGLVAVFIGLVLFRNFGSFEDASWTKLWMLLIMILFASVGLSLIFNKKQYVLNTARIFSGILFIFSGFVKAVDPLGSKYKFIDYFQAWGMDFLEPSALTFGIILSTLELVVGVALLFRILPKLSSFLGFAFMVFFTPVTLYLALQQNISGKELVHDCGCFGDALVLTNWQTFVKNLLILIPVFFAFFYRKRLLPVVDKNKSIKLMIVFVLISLGLSIYALKHLPPIDYRPYKVGTKLICEACQKNKEVDVEEYMYAKFKHTESGEVKEFEIMHSWPTDTNWEYVTPQEPRKVVVEPEVEVVDTLVKEKSFTIEQFMFMKGQEDYTCNVVKDTNYVFLFVAYNVNEASLDAKDVINNVYNWAHEKNYNFYGASSSLDGDIEKYSSKANIQFPFLGCDDIPLKTIVRANPGLVILKDGVVIDKWHYNDIPSIEELEHICK